jgi:hypothetical protein
MKITKSKLAEIVKEIVQEEKAEYEKFFRAMLKKHGVSSPAELSDEEKKKFFNQVDAEYKAKHEGNAFGAAVTAAKEKGEDEFEVGGKTYKVESVVNEDANMNKKVKQLLDKNLKELTKGKPNHQFAVMHILMGALSDANFHSEAKQVAKLFPKAKYEGDPMAAKDVEEYYHYELGPDVANICKWDGKDIVDAIGFYVSMTIGRPVGEKVEKLVESVNEAYDFKPNKNMNNLMKGRKIKNVVYSDKLGFAIILDNGKFVLIRGHRATPGSEKELELESVNESAGCGCGCGCGSVNEGFYKSIMSNGGRNLFFAMVNDKTDEVKTIDAKTWLSSSLMDNASKHSKERVVKAILRNQKQFNKKVEFNMWAKKNRPNFKETMEYFFKNGFINNITNKGIKVYESKEEAVFEGRAFVAAAKKAKEEGKTEFEFNGKKYPVTLKD